MPQLLVSMPADDASQRCRHGRFVPAVTEELASVQNLRATQRFRTVVLQMPETAGWETGCPTSGVDREIESIGHRTGWWTGTRWMMDDLYDAVMKQENERQQRQRTNRLLDKLRQTAL